MTHQDFLKGAGMELRVARIRKGLSSADVAQMTGLSASSIIAIENGKNDSKILSYKRIADSLGVSLKDIL